MDVLGEAWDPKIVSLSKILYIIAHMLNEKPLERRASVKLMHSTFFDKTTKGTIEIGRNSDFMNLTRTSESSEEKLISKMDINKQIYFHQNNDSLT